MIRWTQRNFNPRSPHGERHSAETGDVAGRGFQSTLPARGATPPEHQALRHRENFNPRSPHGERPIRISFSRSRRNISIHAPRTGSDLDRYEGVPHYYTFQSTLPARGATGKRLRGRCARGDFNPRSPHGERLMSMSITIYPPSISIHAPRTGSDHLSLPVARGRQISIHAPRTGSDTPLKAALVQGEAFQSTLPARGATQ